MKYAGGEREMNAIVCSPCLAYKEEAFDLQLGLFLHFNIGWNQSDPRLLNLSLAHPPTELDGIFGITGEDGE